ncbi:hypothetical protein TWF481_000513 [Arthrobotrys musiformis]|uniref:F-box domain-containing protein n=1 Tax=Arthrobotrys musiformis TaxID=47236 RepID=A0AAV9WN45_9PEZI
MAQPATLAALPEEILLQILIYVSNSTTDSLAVLHTSKRLSRIIKPLLYRTILLPARKVCYAYGSKGVQDRILSVASNIDFIAQYIQDFGLCRGETALKTPIRGIEYQVVSGIQSLLTKVPPGQLLSFRWDIHARCPAKLIHHLHDHQRNLETLIIYHRSFNHFVQPPYFTFNLLNFKNLCHLCIYGYMPKPEYERLTAQLPTILQTLKTLVVVQLRPGHHLQQAQWPSRFIDRMTGRSPKSYELIYPSLETFAYDNNDAFTISLFAALSLESISQLPNLRALHSRFFLTTRLIVNFDPRVPILLQTLEVWWCNMRLLSKFLLAFQGLVNLDILVPQPEDFIDAAPILHHATSLRSLALWKVRSIATQGPFMVPMPHSLMMSLGKGLQKLEEFCATLHPDYDPFKEHLFPNLKLLWAYNSDTRDLSPPDIMPKHPWMPPQLKRAKDRPEWTRKNTLLQRDLSAYPDLTIPKTLKAVAFGHFQRVFGGSIQVNGVFHREDVDDEVGESGNNIISWRRIAMGDLVKKYPDLLSPYEATFGVPLMERYAPGPGFSV